MSAFEEQPVVGLFGTCGDSTFRRDLFIPEYKHGGIDYFNPQVDDWRPELADIEADHLLHDVVQCWPVLGSTYGAGSLAEQGFSIASSLRAPTPLPKFVLPMIEMELSDTLDNEEARKDSLRARKLAKTHLERNESPNVFIMESLDEMLEASIALYGAAKVLVEVSRGHNAAYHRFMQGRSEQAALAQALTTGRLGKEAAAIAERQRRRTN